MKHLALCPRVLISFYRTAALVTTVPLRWSQGCG